MPKSVYGNKIDWNEAEASGVIKVKDYIEVIDANGTYIRFFNGIFDGIFIAKDDFRMSF